MMTQNQIQEIARKQAQTKKNGAMFLALAGTVLVMVACYGITFTNNINYMVVLIVGFIVAMFGFIGSKE
jgi:predicted CDP-diglyceride synthetase/phosphatidate cytidylyltransferase